MTGNLVTEKQTSNDVEDYEAQLAAVRSERDELRTALDAAQRNPQDVVRVSDYEWHVELAAKGLAERDSYPIPHSVTTPKAFYEVMAAAALDATGLRALLERVARAERDLEAMRKAISQADAEAGNGRHRTTNATAAAGGIPAVPIPSTPSAGLGPREGPRTSAQAPAPTATTGTPAPSAPRHGLRRAMRRSPVRIVLR